MTTTLSVVIPCYNESATLSECVAAVRAIASSSLDLEIVIVDDGSTDDSLHKARELEARHPEVRVLAHDLNRGKGAALRTAFGLVTGDYVAVQDADLEYDPNDLVRLLEPLVNGKADVVLGSRFLTGEIHRVLGFWHSMGNRLLTLMSNIFTDLRLSDMETCYKVFKRNVIQSIDIHEDRFGFEPEIVAKLAQRRLRIYEMGISYYGRSYEDGKKIGAVDGLRALYCVVKYNASSAPVAIQFLLYCLVGGLAGLVNLLVFCALLWAGASLGPSVLMAFGLAAMVNYGLCVRFLFNRHAGWSQRTEWIAYASVVLIVGLIDYAITRGLVGAGYSPIVAKALATLMLPVLNFAVRRYLVFAPLRGDSVAFDPSD